MTTTTLRDTEDRAVRVEFMLGLDQVFEHDAEGNVTRFVDANRDIRLSYGCFHRLVEREEDGTRVAFGYDTECRLIGVTNEAGEVYAFELDRAGRVISETGFDGERRSYVLDVEGRVTQTVLPSGGRAMWATMRPGACCR